MEKYAFLIVERKRNTNNHILPIRYKTHNPSRISLSPGDISSRIEPEAITDQFNCTYQSGDNRLDL